MKITAPVNSVEDALAVGKAGADEIYFGVVPKGYSYLVQINRRDMEGAEPPPSDPGATPAPQKPSKKSPKKPPESGPAGGAA